jgi:hypothetical protein
MARYLKTYRYTRTYAPWDRALKKICVWIARAIRTAAGGDCFHIGPTRNSHAGIQILEEAGRRLVVGIIVTDPPARQLDDKNPGPWEDGGGEDRELVSVG